jgi:23S rRNA (cytosine1962-C5)-methyltransferase
MSIPSRTTSPRRRAGSDENSSASGARHEPRVRRGVLRVPAEVAWRLRSGHPWVFRDSLGNRPLRDVPGEIVELVGPEGGPGSGFVARGIYDPEGPIAVRVLTRDADEVIDPAAFLRRVTAARRLRDSLLPDAAGPQALTAYRAFHGEGDFVPGFTVDRYDDFMVVHLFTASLDPHLPALLDAVEAVWQPRGIYLQRRYRPLGGEGPREPAELVRGQVAPVEIEVREGALRFGIDVTAPLGTGLFPDLRLGRQRVGSLASGRRVLNLFSYTGALSLYAAAGGAKEVVSVDLSPKAHARARRNLERSGLPEAGHEFIAADAFAVMARMYERKRTFDLVVLDPPAFSQTKNQTFSVQKDYRELVTGALDLCAPGALLCCASNAARVSMEDFETTIGEGASRARRHVRIIEQIGLPVDFPIPAGFSDGHYLKFLTCAVI